MVCEWRSLDVCCPPLEALRCAKLHVPERRSDCDSMIAATAMEHGFAIVTRNVRDFEGTAVQLLNPWG